MRIHICRRYTPKVDNEDLPKCPDFRLPMSCIMSYPIMHGAVYVHPEQNRRLNFYVGVKGDTLDGADQMLEELKAEVLKHFE